MELCPRPAGGAPLTAIFKILEREAWEAARAAGIYAGSPVDLGDGYMHFSTADQAAETARRYFSHQPDLVVLVVDSDALGPALKWEPARDGALFPHLYAPLPTDRVLAVRTAPLGADGVPDLGDLSA